MNHAEQQLSKTLRSLVYNLELASYNMRTSQAFVEDAVLAGMLGADAQRLALAAEAMQGLLGEVQDGRICRLQQQQDGRRAG
ncbi:hypothetical protein ACA097_21500 [Pseudomonas sp. QL9]|uniref:Uncharacterized protein n=1 Tax=Pseudomonas knackmussii (strain DSM 6978 / CCUG 54928 / LMG 23759 / B13) TaxID=1301098 RepID=A0A024HLP2_PSEKB|nr:hypothetical protein [Pseudomonas knackmussii]CDF85358.1 hypothetical protein PKB_4029 [Pseudomonas knackmussii B13]